MLRLPEVGRWLFLGTLVYAPWAYGGTTPQSIKVLDILLGISLGLWIVELVVRRRKPPIPVALGIVILAILVLGWCMALNARAVFDEHFEIFLLLSKHFEWAPSSVDRALSIAWMERATMLIGCVAFVTDLCRRDRWLLRLWITLAATGASIALLGLLQKASGAVMPFWEYRPWEFSSFFATYYYHANAGAFLNLVLPPTIGLALRALSKAQAGVEKGIWFAATLLILIAIAVNTSRMAQALGLLVIILMAAGPARRRLWWVITTNRMTTGFAVVIAATVVFAIAQASHIDKPIQRWRSQSHDLIQNERWLVDRIALEALPAAGFFGFGPGTFRAVFPRYLERTSGERPGGIWTYLHQDYLQTLLEWGWIGTLLWAILLIGGIATGLRALRIMQKRRIRNRWRLALPLSLIALSSAVLHGLVDFPFQIYSIQLYTAVYLGICWASARAQFGSVPARLPTERISPELREH